MERFSQLTNHYNLYIFASCENLLLFFDNRNIFFKLFFNYWILKIKIIQNYSIINRYNQKTEGFSQLANHYKLYIYL
jgi:hypothetical protein